MSNYELYHYGVKGMKWGVRRYRNYGGTYTERGVKRFDENMADYEVKDANYKSAKQTGTRSEMLRAKSERKVAKRRLDSSYKQLKMNKLADQGKDLYADGKSIYGNKAKTRRIGRIGAVSLYMANRMYRSNTPQGRMVANFLATVGIGATIGTAVRTVTDYDQNRKLRAYYEHSYKPIGE